MAERSYRGRARARGGSDEALPRGCWAQGLGRCRGELHAPRTSLSSDVLGPGLWGAWAPHGGVGEGSALRRRYDAAR